MTDQYDEPASFLSLLEVHRRLDELFLLHQEALLALDPRLALERLREFKGELQVHMRAEEELLLPVYERAGRIQGGPVEFFTGEHKRMLEFIARFDGKLEKLVADQMNLKRDIISLFDGEAVFKQLMEHHDAREQNILYPALDRVTSEQERRRLLSLCRELTAF
jgi:hemerythrin-like domain-containing protein